MANCPKCGRKLHFTDWRPECPGCGVNLNYYKANEKLLEDSEKVEIQHAKSQPRTDRIKAATIGSNRSIVRMILFLIPILSLLLPVFTITSSGVKKNYNAIDIYNIISALDTGKVLSDISPLVIGVVLLALPAVCCLVFMILQITAGTKKGLSRNIGFSAASLVLAAASLVCVLVFCSNPAEDYANLVLNETETAVKNGSQSAVDSSVQNIRNIFNDDTVDVDLLIRAISSGKDALATAKDRGYTDEQVTVLNDALKTGEEVLSKDGANINEVRDAANGINVAVNSYNDFETAIKYISEINNDNGFYSENSFTNLTDRLNEVKEADDTLKNGGYIVETTKDNGATQKTEEEIAEGTKERKAELVKNLNGAAASLSDITVIVPQCEKLSASLKDGSFSADAKQNVKASVNIGIILFIVLLIVQLANNIRIKKKGIVIKHTPCLIGGLPSDEYFRYVEEGMDKEQIHRKMLVALAKLQEEAEANLKKEEEKNG